MADNIPRGQLGQELNPEVGAKYPSPQLVHASAFDWLVYVPGLQSSHPVPDIFSPGQHALLLVLGELLLESPESQTTKPIPMATRTTPARTPKALAAGVGGGMVEIWRISE
jgi:hypothetical protein